jgi:uroporphyrinogen decarboxylase
MTPRERVQLAIDHRDTDRVPTDFLATPETWARIETHLGIEDREQILRRLGVDVRHPRQPYIGPPIVRHGDGSWSDPWGVRRRSIPNPRGAYDEIVGHPLSGLSDPAELETYPWPRPEWWDAEALRGEIRVLDREQPYAIALEEFGDPGGIFEIAWYLRGMEQLLVDMIERPAMAWEIMRRVTDFYLGMLERVIAVCGDRIDLIWTSDDIAHQRGRLMSERLWRELIAPHHERFNKRVHELGSRVMYHSCGAVRPFIPGLIDIGVDVLDVLQFSAAGMDPAEIKSAFGGRLAFHGGMDVQTTLPQGTEEEVRMVTRERIDVLGCGGGYILSPTHNIQADTPPENVVAMYDEAGSLEASGASGGAGARG